MNIEVGKMELFQQVVNNIDTPHDFMLMKEQSNNLYFLIFFRLEVEFIKLKLQIMNLMLIAIWTLDIMDTPVLFHELLKTKGIL